MNINFTERNEAAIKDFFSSVDKETDFDFIADKAAFYLKTADSFKHFDDGLIQLFERKKYNVDLNNRNEMADFLISKLDRINSDIENKTVYSWFLGKHRPKIEAGSRRKMYEICFALELNIEDTVWFFTHVYCDRAFNCHTIDEAVFYYAFSNGLSYEKALDIIDTIEKADASSIEQAEGAKNLAVTTHYKKDFSEKIPFYNVASDNNHCGISSSCNSVSDNDIPVSHYTVFVKKELDNIKSADELTDFLIINKTKFKSWNLSAAKTIKEILSEITVPPDKKQKVDILKRKLNKSSTYDNKNITDKNFSNDNVINKTNKLNHTANNIAIDNSTMSDKHRKQNLIYPSDYDDCGLIMQEIIFDSLIDGRPQKDFIKGLLEGRNFTKNASVLRYLLTTDKGTGKNAEIPYILRNSFPSKKTMSDILSDEKIAISKSYDTIRKMLILLEFYHFYANAKINFDFGADNKHTPDTISADCKDNLLNAYINANFSQYAKTYKEETNYLLFDCGYEDLYAGNPYDWLFLCSSHAKKPLEFFKSCFYELLYDEK